MQFSDETKKRHIEPNVYIIIDNFAIIHRG